jgi:hypothetical protein
MDTKDAYLSAAQAYADGVRALLSPSAGPAAERGVLEAALAPDIAGRAERLAPLSARLTQAAAAQLEDDDPAVRMRASSQLLAKALTDLQISTYLLQLAEDAEAGLAGAEIGDTRRGPADLGPLEGHLELLLVPVAFGLARLEPPGDLATARVRLTRSVADALELISSRAARTGQTALAGLLGLGLTEVARAAGVVGLDLARVLGQAEKVSQLYHLFRRYAVQAYESLLALLGPQLARIVAQQVVEWVEEVKEGERFGRLLEMLYETEQTRQGLQHVVTQSEADLDLFVAAMEDVEILGASYQQQIDLSEKLLKGLKWLALVPAAALPQGRLLMAAAYLVLGGYIVLAGADYVDAQRLEWLDRVPGVRRTVESHLATSEGPHRRP